MFVSICICYEEPNYFEHNFYVCDAVWTNGISIWAGGGPQVRRVEITCQTIQAGQTFPWTTTLQVQASDSWLFWLHQHSISRDSLGKRLFYGGDVLPIKF